MLVAWLQTDWDECNGSEGYSITAVQVPTSQSDISRLATSAPERLFPTPV